MSWGDSFVTGLNAGVAARGRYENHNLALGQFDEELRQNKLRDSLNQDRLDTAAKRLVDETAAREADPSDRLRRAKAQLELDQLGKPFQPTPDDLLTADVKRRKLQKELDGLNAPLAGPSPDEMLTADVKRLKLEQEKTALTAPVTPTPMAKVTQNFGADGKSHAQFQVPLEEFRKTAGAASYRSPYGEDIADLGRKVADQQAEQDGGDMRTGFFNFTSRKSVVDDATRKQRRLQALELQDMLAKGVIDQAEADRRATLILGGRAK